MLDRSACRTLCFLLVLLRLRLLLRRLLLLRVSSVGGTAFTRIFSKTPLCRATSGAFPKSRYRKHLEVNSPHNALLSLFLFSSSDEKRGF